MTDCFTVLQPESASKKASHLLNTSHKQNIIAVSNTHIYSIKKHIVMCILYTRHLTWKSFQWAEPVKEKHHIYTQLAEFQKQKQL
jgi:non-homologous end joining protein Ku